jgi:hypothetical protein
LLKIQFEGNQFRTKLPKHQKMKHLPLVQADPPWKRQCIQNCPKHLDRAFRAAHAALMLIHHNHDSSSSAGTEFACSLHNHGSEWASMASSSYLGKTQHTHSQIVRVCQVPHGLRQLARLTLLQWKHMDHRAMRLLSSQPRQRQRRLRTDEATPKHEQRPLNPRLHQRLSQHHASSLEL